MPGLGEPKKKTRIASTRRVSLKGEQRLRRNAGRKLFFEPSQQGGSLAGRPDLSEVSESAQQSCTGQPPAGSGLTVQKARASVIEHGRDITPFAVN